MKSTRPMKRRVPWFSVSWEGSGTNGRKLRMDPTINSFIVLTRKYMKAKVKESRWDGSIALVKDSTKKTTTNRRRKTTGATRNLKSREGVHARPQGPKK